MFSKTKIWQVHTSVSLFSLKNFLIFFYPSGGGGLPSSSALVNADVCVFPGSTSNYVPAVCNGREVVDSTTSSLWNVSLPLSSSTNLHPTIIRFERRSAHAVWTLLCPRKSERQPLGGANFGSSRCTLRHVLY